MNSKNPTIINPLENNDIIIKKNGYYKIKYKKKINVNIIVEENIDVIIDEYLDYDNDSKLIIKDKSKVEYYIYFNQDLKIERNLDIAGEIKLFYIDTSNNSNLVNKINLNNIDSKIDFNSIIYASKDNSKDYYLEVNHLSKSTYSDFHNYGVVDNNARVRIDVVSKIKKGMIKSKAYQTSKVISLSDEGSSSLRPKLYIDEYDVEARHGAAFGIINDIEIYYMMSRGIPKNMAKQIIALGNLLSKVPSYKLEDITKILKERMKYE